MRGMGQPWADHAMAVKEPCREQCQHITTLFGALSVTKGTLAETDAGTQDINAQLEFVHLGETRNSSQSVISNVVRDSEAYVCASALGHLAAYLEFPDNGYRKPGSQASSMRQAGPRQDEDQSSLRNMFVEQADRLKELRKKRGSRYSIA